MKLNGEMTSNMDNEQQIDELLTKLIQEKDRVIGYPVAKDFDYSPLYEFLKHPINNVGDPYEDNTYKVQTHEMEREVVDFFAQLFRADQKDFWGYVTNGGSESNLYGLYLARELHPKGMVYFSESTHYSVRKNIHLLNLPSITIRAQENGELDYEDLENTLQLNRDKPAIVLTTFGTTMTEAKDDVSKVKGILKKISFSKSLYTLRCCLSGFLWSFYRTSRSF
ncbi:pyridoxal-dependent decarboxylase [Zobellia nedashkovskayae]